MSSAIIIAIAVFLMLLLIAKGYLKFKYQNPLMTDDVLLNQEELLNHAREIAKEHKSSYRHKNFRSIFSRLNENLEFISMAYVEINKDAASQVPVCPASEWLLDNFYIIEEDAKFLKLNASSKFLKNLKYLDNGYLRNYPRIFAVTLELISHTDGKIEEDKLTGFINAYQSLNYLTMPELWSLSPMFTMALIEKIRKICENIIDIQNQWREVEKLKGKDYNDILYEAVYHIKNMKNIEYSYIEHLLRYFKKEGLSQDSVLNALNSKLAEYDTDLEKIINHEHQEQASLQISMGNCISSLRLIKSVEWDKIFESLSIVEKIFMDDPSGIYSKQDFQSRDFYRRTIEKISKKLNVSETKAARQTVECAKKAYENNNEFRFTHIGYYIMGKGRNLLCSQLKQGYRESLAARHSLSLYLSFIFIFSIIGALTSSIYSYITGGSINAACLVFILFLLPSSDIFIHLANWAVSRLTEPSFLPKLEYKEGVPESATTIVIVPTILSNVKRTEELLSQLEVTYLANREDNIYFALIGDYKDAVSKNTPSDKAISDTGLNMILKLNKKYGNGKNVFFLFLRSRTFSKSQGKWMGWERKRGAIVEFNELLKGSEDTTYSIISGDIEPLKKVKYIITLDADTIMTIGTAKKLIGTISHPLNCPVFDNSAGIVTSGHGIIQPRISINIESSSKSLFTRIFAGNGGIDTYTTAVSDIYQDLFDEGIFTGKGIYDIEVFRNALNSAIPENTVLSHDLLEGSYLRTGLASDIEFIDGYPEKYSSYMMRLHRWVRGDWQLIKWLFPMVLNKNSGRIKNPINMLSRWKIFDNLRRSLISPGVMIIIILGITILPGNSYVWLASGLFIFLFPLIMGLLNLLFIKYHSIQKERITGNVILGFKAAIIQTIVNFIFLPYHSYMMLNALTKTLYRVFISKRNLLEWVTAADAERNTKNDFLSYLKRMLPSLAVSFLFFIAVLSYNPSNVWTASVFLIIWGLSPYVAYNLSIPCIETRNMPIPEDIKLLRRIGRKTWAFYEDFADSNNNYLPVDNYQETPIDRVAYRTSPTNIGFLLISILAARDFGYINSSQMADWVDKTIKTIEKMVKWKGHLYNWYDNRTLEVLRPLYISTVDSGNLVGYYMTLKEGLNEYLKKPMFEMSLLQGLMDTIKLYESSESERITSINEMATQSSFSIANWHNLLASLKNYYENRTDADKKIIDSVNSHLKELEELLPREIIAFESLPESIRTVFENIDIYEDTSLIMLKNKYELLGEKIELAMNSKDASCCSSEYSSILNTINYVQGNVDKKINFINEIIARIEKLINNTEFTPLFDFKHGAFSIGYNAESNKLTNSYYDLFASEARITSYLAAARREVPVSHWFKLGRALTRTGGYKGLVSWTGTMFEYMMPPLIMKNYPNTLLSETYSTVIRAQIRYGQMRSVPWGTSESGYYTFDLNLNYQYKAFGVPELGLKRGLVNDMVVSPYSTMLALPYSPEESIKNLKELIELDMEGSYGLYEALDYTPERLDQRSRKDHSIVKSYMAHHQGMIFTALNNYLNNNIMVKRFHSSPLIKAGEFLLQEKIPLKVLITKEHKERIKPFERIEYVDIDVVRKAGLFESPVPSCHLLTNGAYSIMVNNSGSGYSKMDDTMLTRWKEDLTVRKTGIFFYLRDLKTGKVWSSGFEPLNILPDSYEAVFSQDKAEFLRRDGEIETRTDICISPEDNCEIRKIVLTNHGNQEVLIECTSYLEIVLASHMADIAHPAFSNLFVRTEVLKECCSLIASRRPREEHRNTIWSFQTLSVDGETIGGIEYETDRHKFIGRGRSLSNPQCLYHPLSNTTGSVLDPVMSLRRKVKVPAGKSATLCFTFGISQTREEAVFASKKYGDTGSIARAFELSYMRSQMETKYLSLKPSAIELFDDMIPHILYPNPKRNEYQNIIFKNTKGQQNLWHYGISGDVPIVLVSISNTEDIDIVRSMLKAHEYWKSRGLKVDLVILNEDESSYLQPLQDLLKDVLFASHARDIFDRPGGLFIRNANIMSTDDIVLLYSVSRLIIKAELGSIVKQIIPWETDIQYHVEKNIEDYTPGHIVGDEHPVYSYFNSYGGFDTNNREYAIILKEGIHTPSPWCNVIANEKFGFLVSESGSGHTWYENSRENKLTPWSNDPVSDPPGEVIYIRDDDTGEFWTITPLPIREKETYEVSHGLGYTRFSHTSHELNQVLTVFVPREDSVKISFVSLKNNKNSRRKLSIFYYIRPVLGVSDHATQLFITTEWDNNSETLLIRNSYNTDFPGYIAFMNSSVKIHGFTGSRMDFLGVYGNLSSPEAVKKGNLSNNTGAGYDPCCVIHCKIELEPNQEEELIFNIGEERNLVGVRELASKYKIIEECKNALTNIKAFWRNILETLQVKTPDAGMDLMLNHWLLYQNISCRLWARSAFYQSGGAYGFRDQLQDVLSIMHILPETARKQILIHCSHQFIEGDVLHWWHPGICDKGIRTRFSDDLVWLPYVTAEYIEKTGDISLLHEEISFLEDTPLKENEDERYGVPSISNEKSTVFDHCIRAINRALKFGGHGIPLMGSGDWNDGMNTVGNKGRGESIWLGWFLYSTLRKFADVCIKVNDYILAEKYISEADKLSENLDANAWDGEWYRRAYFDNGIPLGSSINSECKIDSIAQSWAAISGAGRREKILTAMKSLDDYLIDRNHGLILLLTPPFEDGDLLPGYIRGYVPGVRENGGQYTHAATWVIYAYAMLGYGNMAHELFHLINPVNHTKTHLECLRYKVEPYVIAADVYAADPHKGRGGWTWYTGSASWMYKVGIEQILGFNKKADKIIFDPCIPSDWKEYTLRYKYNDTVYNITIKNQYGINKGVKKVVLDKEIFEGNVLQLVNDMKEHNVEVIMG